MNGRQCIIQERSIVIPIFNNLSTYNGSPINAVTYSLKRNFFDPVKNSPPNDFLNKLQQRMNIYQLDDDDSLEIKPDIRVKK
jgi:hypothetical protein